jgi:hypothetical protein
LHGFEIVAIVPAKFSKHKSNTDPCLRVPELGIKQAAPQIPGMFFKEVPMLKRSFITSLAILAIASFCHSTLVNATELPGRLKVGDSELTLNGWGVRQKSLLKLYKAGIYLKKPTSNAASVINANEAMAITIEITSGFVSQEKMVAALNEGLQNSTSGRTAALKTEIEQFQACFADDITKSDVFSIIYRPSHGVVVSKNGRQKGVIKGLAFKKALFGIWLGNNPVDQKLKNAMLAQ